MFVFTKAEEKIRQEKKKAQELADEERKKKELAQQEEERKKEEAEKRLREEKERKEHEEYLKLKEAFSVQEEGFEETEDNENLLQDFVNYIKVKFLFSKLFLLLFNIQFYYSMLLKFLF